MKNELIISIGAGDCVFDYMRGTGPGGQKRNKTESKVRCTHKGSGAVAESDETRSQHENKKKAFGKMARSETFQKWLKLEVARRQGVLHDIEEKVEAMMKREIRVEYFDVEQQKWIKEENGDR